MPELIGLSCKSKAVVFTAFCSSPVRRARLSVKVSAMRNSKGNRIDQLEMDDFNIAPMLLEVFSNKSSMAMVGLVFTAK